MKTYPKIEKEKSTCLNDQGNVDYYIGHFKCPLCGEDTNTWYPWSDKDPFPTLQYCRKCNKYFKF